MDPLTHSLHGVAASVKLLDCFAFPAVRGRMGPVDDDYLPLYVSFHEYLRVLSLGICNGPQRSLSLSLEKEMAPETMIPCLENGHLVAGNKVPVSCVCLTAVPSDESIWEMLSPKLSTGTAILGQDETRACQPVQGSGLPAVCEEERYHLSHKNSLG